jgi:hypothetical protein
MNIDMKKKAVHFTTLEQICAGYLSTVAVKWIEGYGPEAVEEVRQMQEAGYEPTLPPELVHETQQMLGSLAEPRFWNYLLVMYCSKEEYSPVRCSGCHGWDCTCTEWTCPSDPKVNMKKQKP